MWYVSSAWTSFAFDVFQKFRNTLTHLSENLKIPVKLLLKYSVYVVAVSFGTKF